MSGCSGGKTEALPWPSIPPVTSPQTRYKIMCLPPPSILLLLEKRFDVRVRRNKGGRVKRQAAAEYCAHTCFTLVQPFQPIDECGHGSSFFVSSFCISVVNSFS